MLPVKVYSTPICPYCHTLKAYLKERNVEFEDIDVSKDQNAKIDMIRKSNQLGVPVMEIGEHVIIGFDKEKINKLLNLEA